MAVNFLSFNRWCAIYGTMVACLLLLCLPVNCEGNFIRYVFGCHKSGTGNPYERAWITKHLVGDCEQDMICLHDLLRAYKAKNHDVVKPYFRPGM